MLTSFVNVLSNSLNKNQTISSIALTELGPFENTSLLKTIAEYEPVACSEGLKPKSTKLVQKMDLKHKGFANRQLFTLLNVAIGKKTRKQHVFINTIYIPRNSVT